MSCDCLEPSEPANRTYQYLVLVELVLTIVALALSIVNAVGAV